MQIDLNDPEQFTRDNVAKLLASVVDDRHWQLRVKKSGIAYMSQVVASDDIDDLAFRFETWCRGNSYVGEAAAGDDRWVGHVFAELSKNWPVPTTTFVD